MVIEGNQILIVYIATGEYKKMFKGFYDSIHKFCPNTDKHLFIWTDDCDYFRDYYDFNVDVRYYPHQPWPLNALMKFKMIKDAYDITSCNQEFTHVFYFNSNIKFVAECTEEDFLMSPAIAVMNCGAYHLGPDPRNYTYGKSWEEMDPDHKFACHIDDPNYTYVQSSVMGGKASSYIDLVEACIDLTEYDLAHNRIPVFHDESYWNKVVWKLNSMNPNYVKILPPTYNADEVHQYDWGTDNAYIVMRDSSKTQYEYKDKFHETKID